jgi:hypothetical protein
MNIYGQILHKTIFGQILVKTIFGQILRGQKPIFLKKYFLQEKMKQVLIMCVVRQVSEICRNGIF